MPFLHDKLEGGRPDPSATGHAARFSFCWWILLPHLIPSLGVEILSWNDGKDVSFGLPKSVVGQILPGFFSVSVWLDVQVKHNMI